LEAHLETKVSLIVRWPLMITSYVVIRAELLQHLSSPRF